MTPATGRPLEDLSVLLADCDVATRAAGWWLEQLGATVTSDSSRAADVAVVRGHDGDDCAAPAGARTTIVINSPPAAVDSAREAAGLWLRSGLASLTRSVAEERGERPPCLPTVPFPQGLGAMVVALMVAAYATQARRNGGRWVAPRVIEIDLLELLCLLPSQFVALAQVPSQQVASVVGAVGWRIGGVIETADGAVCAQAPEPSQWARLLPLLPGGEAIASAITDPVELRDHAGTVDRLLREWAASHTKQEVSDLAQQVRVPVTPLLRPEELPSNPHYSARGFFTSTTPRRTRLPWLARTPDQRTVAHRNVPGDGGSTDLPLSGVRVLDLTWAWAGPFATTLLAELGAEVINIEWFPRPSNLRVQQPLVGGFGFDGCAWWSATQRGKSSVGINFKHDDGRRLVVDLARRCDVVIDNFAPGVVDRLGIGFDDLVTVNPNLVYVSMSAFGSVGPSSHFVGYGTHLYASAGLSYVITSPDGGPSEMTIPLPDPISGIAGAIAVAAHLASGRGVHVDVSDLEATCLSRLDGMVDCNSGLRFEANAGPDGWRVRFDDGTEERVPSIAEMLHDERLSERRFWLLDQHEAFRDRDVRYGGAPWLLDGQRTTALAAAPDLFSGTHATLTDILGLTDARIHQLAAAGAIHLRPRPNTDERDDRPSGSN
jgi:crotonobetainyl-CoA:carnitine CoA-transferase CaiB-like acyl-CoA transferase